MDNTLTALILSAMLMLTASNYTNSTQPPEAAPPAVSAEASQRADVKIITTIRKVPNPLGLSLGQLTEGTSVTVTDTTTVLGTDWARVDTGAVIGWVPMDMLELDQGNHFVKVEKLTRLYTSPSDNSITLALLPKDHELLVLRSEKVAGVSWLYVNSAQLAADGWIRAAAVDMTGVTPLEPTPAPTQPTQPTTVSNQSMSYIRMGVVVNVNRELNVRTGPGVNYERIDSCRYGERIGIYETRYGWGRTDKGWVSLDYVYLDGDVGSHPMLGAVSASTLRVRTGPGTGYGVVRELAQDKVVVILEQIQVGSSKWGCTKQGWVCMDYITPETLPEPTTPIYAYGFVNSSTLNVRTGPGVGYERTTSFQFGDLLSILEATDVGTVKWGRTASGWVCMSYVSILQTFEQPEAPTESVSPTEPDAPATPDAPAESEAPADPQAFAEPETPEEPESPAEAETSAESETPEEHTVSDPLAAE